MNAHALKQLSIPPSEHPLERIPASFPLRRRWYAFYSHIRAEAAAGARIAELGYQTFVPIEKRIRRLPGVTARPYEAALFPRYGFVRFDINDAGWAFILGVKGVIDLLRSNDIPRAIDDNIISQLSLAYHLGLFDRTKPPQTGTLCEFIGGPFTGLIGPVLDARRRARSDDYEYVVDILLQTIFGSQRTVTAPLALLREV